MAQVIVVTSGKGGVGKTTSSAAFATGLAQSGKKVLMVTLLPYEKTPKELARLLKSIRQVSQDTVLLRP